MSAFDIHAQRGQLSAAQQHSLEGNKLNVLEATVCWIAHCHYSLRSCRTQYRPETHAADQSMFVASFRTVDGHVRGAHDDMPTCGQVL